VEDVDASQVCGARTGFGALFRGDTHRPTVRLIDVLAVVDDKANTSPAARGSFQDPLEAEGDLGLVTIGVRRDVRRERRGVLGALE